jgi:hypothetical protein
MRNDTRLASTRTKQMKKDAHMATATDPFVHHPELRDLIDEPENCFFRTFTTTKLAEMAREKGIRQ